jgi:hypothetical protein
MLLFLGGGKVAYLIPLLGTFRLTQNIFDEPLRFDILVDNCLLLELKAVETLHPFSKAQLFSYMKLLDIPIGLLINFHEPVLKSGIARMILPGANQTEGNEGNKGSF